MDNEFDNGNADNIGNAQTTTVKVITKQETEMPDKPKRKYTEEPVVAVLKKSHNQFMRQVEKNTDTKRKCIEANISKHYDDELRFWIDFNKKVGMLLDSNRFNAYCNGKKHVAQYVAEHIVFESKKIYNEVLSGDYRTIDEMAHMFNANLFIDTEKIYDKPKQIAQVATS